MKMKMTFLFSQNCLRINDFCSVSIAVIPAGEKWSDGSLRLAIEDLIGAGAILSYLKGSPSPEAETAVTVFYRWQNELLSVLKKSISGQELIGRGFLQDVELASVRARSPLRFKGLSG